MIILEDENVSVRRYCDVCGSTNINTSKRERPLICSHCWDELDSEGRLGDFKTWFKNNIAKEF